MHYYSHFAKIPLPAPQSPSMDNGEEGNLLLLINPTETEWEINVSWKKKNHFSLLDEKASFY